MRNGVREANFPKKLAPSAAGAESRRPCIWERPKVVVVDAPTSVVLEPEMKDARRDAATERNAVDRVRLNMKASLPQCIGGVTCHSVTMAAGG
jgi:hypothetical protein